MTEVSASDHVAQSPSGSTSRRSRGGAEVPPRVSIVLPTYRRGAMLRRALDTVMEQTLRDWELIVVDDNGAGHAFQRETETLLERFRDDERIVYVVHEHNRGGGAARNTGIGQARAEYVAFLDDDDAWYPDKLERQLACFDQAPADVALVYGGFRVISRRGPAGVVMPDPEGHTVSALLQRNTVGTTSLVMCRRSALEAIGGFDPQLRSRQDVDLFVRLAQRYRFAYVDAPLLDKHEHEEYAIGKDKDGAVDAYRRFYAKYRDAYDGDAPAHHAFLRRYGEEALRAGRTHEARRLLRSAWRLQPRSWRTLLLALVSYRPVLAAYRSVRERLGLRQRVPVTPPEEPLESS